MRHPRVRVTDLEARMNTRATADTLAGLQARYPGVRFVWLMGADNLASFHLWDRWQEILETVPVGVLARPGQRISARTSAAAEIYRHARVDAAAATRLPELPPPAWSFLNIPMSTHSSTAIRSRGGWAR
jgi:nicotinate-nucleotide adenylyltransferase